MACVPSVAASVLPGVLAEFQRDRPKIQVSLRELTSQELMEAVANQDVDFGTGPRVDRLGDFDFLPIISEPICALLPRPYWMAARKFITLAELAALPVLLASTSAALRGNLDQELSARNLTIRSSFEVIHVQTMLSFARAGLGVAILPAITIPRPLELDLQVLPIVEPQLQRTICLITLKGTALPPAARELSQLVASRFRDEARFRLDPPS